MTIRLFAALILILSAPSVWAQEAAPDLSQDSSTSDSTAPTTVPPIDAGEEVLACAQQLAHSAGFETQLSLTGRVLHTWHPHLQSINANEMDYVRVFVYGRGSAKGLRWEVKAYTVTGRAVISSGVVGSSGRPPSREADRLRREIQKECAPRSAR